ncbi:unnamed protein product [Soboliphyme baturini]|uniref:PPM-type phosphatase domain-containing protein n=1 Tax=Soboliphyme baturini TaxID=241478 RepID=A0A183IN36_9BILA|nr:unnamed protein product [Soboliphyme baturini]
MDGVLAKDPDTDRKSTTYVKCAKNENLFTADSDSGLLVTVGDKADDISTDHRLPLATSLKIKDKRKGTGNRSKAG